MHERLPAQRPTGINCFPRWTQVETQLPPVVEQLHLGVPCSLESESELERSLGGTLAGMALASFVWDLGWDWWRG